MIKTLQIFEFNSLQEAMSRGFKARPRRSKRVCEVTAGRSRLQAKSRRTEGRLVCGDATAESKEGTFRVRGGSAREAARVRSCGDETDVQKAHLDVRCDEEGHLSPPASQTQASKQAATAIWAPVVTVCRGLGLVRCIQRSGRLFRHSQVCFLVFRVC